jgi:hypothetical protein
MTRMRGVDSFSRLWSRRSSIELPGGTRCDVMSLPDLVQAKKTQRDKDWPMLRRLLEADYFRAPATPSARQVRFWLRELRTPELLVEVAQRWPAACEPLKTRRPLLHLARRGQEPRLADALAAEERRERRADARYWAPLKSELEALRLERVRRTAAAPQ